MGKSSIPISQKIYYSPEPRAVKYDKLITVFFVKK